MRTNWSHTNSYTNADCDSSDNTECDTNSNSGDEPDYYTGAVRGGYVDSHKCLQCSHSSGVPHGGMDWE